jgi:hypothetical protein
MRLQIEALKEELSVKGKEAERLKKDNLIKLD